MNAKWNFSNNSPIYTQITAKIKALLASGSLKPGERLPSVRELAGEAGVNPNTVQRAFSELEQEGFVHSIRTSGRYITGDLVLIEKMKNESASQCVCEFMKNMHRLGCSDDQIISMIKSTKEDKQ